MNTIKDSRDDPRAIFTEACYRVQSYPVLQDCKTASACECVYETKGLWLSVCIHLCMCTHYRASSFPASEETHGHILLA